MNPVHLHLILTHVPVLGTLFAVVLLGIGVARRSDELKKIALWSFAVFAALSIPLFLTGEPAEEAVEHLPGVSKSAIETHEDVAKVAFAVILSLGAIALAGLAFFRRRPIPQWFSAGVGDSHKRAARLDCQPRRQGASQRDQRQRLHNS